MTTSKSDLLRVWESKGYKKMIESSFDYMRIELFHGRALITQGYGAYWQILIISVGVIQVNLLDVNGTLGIYWAHDSSIPSEIKQSKEPDLTNMKNKSPLTCTLDDYPEAVNAALDYLMMAHGWFKLKQTWGIK